MTPDLFLIYHTFDAILGHISISDMIIQILTGLHAYSHSRYMRWDDGVFIILWRSFSGASLGPFSQTYYTFDAILGYVSSLAEIYRSTWSCMLISTYEIRSEAMTYLLSCHDPPSESLLSHLRSHIWWWMISCHLISDLPYIWCHTGAYFHFGWSLRDLHGVTWSFPFTEYTLRWWLVHYCYDDSSVKPLGSHLVRHAPLDTPMSSCSFTRDMHFSLMSVMLLWI